MPPSILFVCLGNICRSPTAEGVLRRLRPDWRIDSAGTGDWHIGAPPHGPAAGAAAARGYDLSGLQARQVRVADFDRFDRIIAMDRQNRADLERLRPPGNATPVTLLLESHPGAAPRDVPDPYLTGDFEAALDLIEAACHGLAEALDPPADPP